MNEEELVNNVLELCAYRHLRTAHFRPARTERGWRTPVSGNGKGFPDLVIVGRRRPLWRETKGPRGRLSIDQQGWLDDLQECGADARVWTVKDWESGLIQFEIDRAAGRERAA